jgi:hypothetical protein
VSYSCQRLTWGVGNSSHALFGEVVLAEAGALLELSLVFLPCNLEPTLKYISREVYLLNIWNNETLDKLVRKMISI